MNTRCSPELWLIVALVCLSNATCWAQTAGEVSGFELPEGFFPILSWDLPHWSAGAFSDAKHGVGSLERCGFNTAAFVRPQHLAAVEKLGMKCILAAQDFPIAWRTLSDQQIESTVKKMVDEAGGSRAVMGYFLADEPGVQGFAALGKAVAAVKMLALGKLAYINLFPDYATLGAPDLSQLGTANYTEYLERYVSEVKPQFISYDNYQVQFSDDLKNAKLAADYFTNMLEVRRVALKHNLPFWNIVSSNRIRPETPVPSPANLLLQAYTTLAAGGKGLTWYTYYSPGYLYTPIDQAGNRTATWSHLKMVNEQVKILGPILRPLRSTGVYFTKPATAALAAPALPALPGDWVESVACAAPLMIGEFDGARDEKYAMVVNLSLRESAQFKLTARGAAGEIRQVSPVDGSLSPLEAGNAVWLSAGQGVLLRR